MIQTFTIECANILLESTEAVNETITFINSLLHQMYQAKQ
jgi:hypothetical protein